MFVVEGSNAMPWALKLPPQIAPSDGGLCHVAPPSVLRQMPPGFTESPFRQVVAITRLALFGAYFTSLIRYGTRVSMWLQLLPPSVDLNRPPLSVAEMTVLGSDGLMSTAVERPPNLVERFGWNSLTEEGSARTDPLGPPAPTAMKTAASTAATKTRRKSGDRNRV